MTENALVRSIGLFFFFALLDEAKAKKATLAVMADLNRQRQLKSDVANDWTSLVVLETEKFWTRIRKKEKARSQGILTFEAGFQIPKNTDFGFWQQFHRNAQEEELLCIIWSQILDFKDVDIAKGLGVTEGTIRHRLARGMRLFGTIMKAGNA